ncbi:uncharacterized protein [Dysidea avara]|uniref:uncharacterized protein n=1 Tax=Dysidea avara TaxID=196820 RepID=UPI00331859D4
MAAQEKSDERAVDEGFIDDNSESPPLSEEIVMDGVEASDLVEEVGDELEEVMEEDDTNESTTNSFATASTITDTGTVDSRGIAGWDKVAQLAEVLVELKGLSVSEEEAQRIKALWDSLDAFDKRVTKVFLRSPPTMRGHFCGQKRTGHTTREQMRRCFLSGVSVPLSLHESRIVEAICILLCNRHIKSGRTSSAGGQSRTYLSKWDKVLKDYTALRARLYNSLDLLEGTNLALYTINKTTLQKWHKREETRKEMLARTQGLELSAPPLCAQEELTSAQRQPLSPPTPPAPFHQFPQTKDTSGQAGRKATAGAATLIGSRVTCAVLPSHLSASLPRSHSEQGLQLQEQEVETSSVSRTTLWRREKKRIAQAAAAGVDQPMPQKKHKKHGCRQCHQPLSAETNHAQYYGKWYCPNKPGQVPVE